MDSRYTEEARDVRRRIETTKADLRKNIHALEAEVDAGMGEAAQALAAIVEKSLDVVSEGLVRGVDRFCADLQSSSIAVRDSIQNSIDELTSALDLRRVAREHPVATVTFTALAGIALSNMIRKRLA